MKKIILFLLLIIFLSVEVSAANYRNETYANFTVTVDNGGTFQFFYNGFKNVTVNSTLNRVSVVNNTWATRSEFNISAGQSWKLLDPVDRYKLIYGNIAPTASTVLANGVFYINDSDNNGVIRGSTSNININCHGLTLIGRNNLKTKPFNFTGTKINLSNCNFHKFNGNLLLYNTQKISNTLINTSNNITAMTNSNITFYNSTLILNLIKTADRRIRASGNFIINKSYVTTNNTNLGYMFTVLNSKRTTIVNSIIENYMNYTTSIYPNEIAKESNLTFRNNIMRHSAGLRINGYDNNGRIYYIIENNTFYNNYYNIYIERTESNNVISIKGNTFNCSMSGTFATVVANKADKTRDCYSLYWADAKALNITNNRFYQYNSGYILDGITRMDKINIYNNTLNGMSKNKYHYITLDGKANTTINKNTLIGYTNESSMINFNSSNCIVKNNYFKSLGNYGTTQYLITHYDKSNNNTIENNTIIGAYIAIRLTGIKQKVKNNTFINISRYHYFNNGANMSLVNNTYTGGINTMRFQSIYDNVTVDEITTTSHIINVSNGGRTFYLYSGRKQFKITGNITNTTYFPPYSSYCNSTVSLCTQNPTSSIKETVGAGKRIQIFGYNNNLQPRIIALDVTGYIDSYVLINNNLYLNTTGVGNVNITNLNYLGRYITYYRNNVIVNESPSNTIGLNIGYDWYLLGTDFGITVETALQQARSQAESTKLTIFSALGIFSLVAILLVVNVLVLIFQNRNNSGDLLSTAIIMIGLTVVIFVGYIVIGFVSYYINLR